MIIDPKTTPTPELHQFLLGSVAPRPIAFVSTVDENGVQNLAPYSFFNAFSSNPPTVVFSSNRRVRDNTTKDTLHNIETTRECVIAVVNHAIVRQMTVASIEYPAGVSEFIKSGLSPIQADLVKPALVKESPVNMECKVRDIVTLGEHGGAGHLIICDVVRMHIRDEVLTDGKIDPHKIDLMGRMGRAFYVRASGSNVYPIIQGITKPGIGFDQLPKSILESNVLTGNQLAQLAGYLQIPDSEEVGDLLKDASVIPLFGNPDGLHKRAQELLAEDKTQEAWQLLMAAEYAKQ